MSKEAEDIAKRIEELRGELRASACSIMLELPKLVRLAVLAASTGTTKGDEDAVRLIDLMSTITTQARDSILCRLPEKPSDELAKRIEAALLSLPVEGKAVN